MINQISFPDLGISFTVNRAAFHLFGMPIYWYGILIAVGLSLAVLYGMREAKRVNLSGDDLLNMILFAVPVAIICARAYYVIFSWQDYAHDLWSIFDIRGGGIAIYGAVIGICIVILCYCKVKKLSVGKVVDILAVGLLIGQAIGRWGNFINGEAFGSFTTLPWAMTVKQDGILIANSVHPTFLYESLWNGIGILLLLLCRRVKEFDGELFAAYLAWYGLGRVWIEGLRADSLYIGDIRVSQLLAALTLVIGASVILIGRIRHAKIK